VTPRVRLVTDGDAGRDGVGLNWVEPTCHITLADRV
jgi:hypothetical protein